MRPEYTKPTTKPDYYYDYARSARRAALEKEQARRSRVIAWRNEAILWTLVAGGLALLAYLEGVI